MTTFGYSGPRVGQSGRQIETVAWVLRGGLYGQPATKVRHGDCTGGDCEFHCVATGMGLWRIIHPPEFDTWRAYCVGDEMMLPKPFLDRNQDIVDGCDRMLATPDGKVEKWGSDTWTTIRYARAKLRPCLLIFPDGSYEHADGSPVPDIQPPWQVAG